MFLCLFDSQAHTHFFHTHDTHNTQTHVSLSHTTPHTRTHKHRHRHTNTHTHTTHTHTHTHTYTHSERQPCPSPPALFQLRSGMLHPLIQVPHPRTDRSVERSPGATKSPQCVPPHSHSCPHAPILRSFFNTMTSKRISPRFHCWFCWDCGGKSSEVGTQGEEWEFLFPPQMFQICDRLRNHETVPKPAMVTFLFSNTIN